MRYSPGQLDGNVLGFLAERHLATLSIIVDEHEIHATPVGFTWDDKATVARVITFAASKKARLLQGRSRPAVLTQVDGGRWLSLHGRATVTGDPVVCADAVRRYAVRYRPPKDRGADRRTIVVDVDRIIGRA